MYFKPELTLEYAEEFEATLKGRIARLVAETINEGMYKHLANSEIAECIQLINDNVSDAIGDMPIWDIAKRTEARMLEEGN